MLKKMSMEQQIEWFNRLMAKKARTQPNTFCVKRNGFVKTTELKGEECCRCENFLFNGGFCDPL